MTMSKRDHFAIAAAIVLGVTVTLSTAGITIVILGKLNQQTESAE